MSSITTPQPFTEMTTTGTNANSICIDDEEEWKPVFSAVLTVGSLVLILVGTVGNTLAYIVLKQKNFQNNLMSDALRYLAVLDTIILWTVVMEVFIKGAFDYDVPSASWETCGWVPFYILSITSFNSWLLVVISAQRLVSLLFPFHEDLICSRFYYYVSLVFTHVVILVAHGSVQLTNYRAFDKEDPIDGTCYFHVNKSEADNPILMFTTVFTNFVIPCFLVIVFTIVMVIELRELERAQLALYRPSTDYSRPSLIPKPLERDEIDLSNSNEEDEAAPPAPTTTERNRMDSTVYKRDTRLNSLTRLLIIASLVYLMLNIPFWSFHFFFAQTVNAAVKGCYQKDLILYSTFLVRYTNYSVNFYIYCAAGPHFRREVYAWVNRTFYSGRAST